VNYGQPRGVNLFLSNSGEVSRTRNLIGQHEVERLEPLSVWLAVVEGVKPMQ
jgi:hypothetical protein